MTMRVRRPYQRTDAHMAYERTLAHAMHTPDAAATLKAAVDGKLVPAGVRKALREVDEDGVHVAAWLIARRRLELLLKGSEQARGWLARDAAGFAAAFQRYHEDVPPEAFFANEEAQAFQRYCEAFYGWRTPHPISTPRDHDARRDLIRERHLSRNGTG